MTDKPRRSGGFRGNRVKSERERRFIGHRFLVGPVRRCPSSGKTYFSKRDAKSAANRHQRGHGIATRCYECPDCGAWHVSRDRTDHRGIEGEYLSRVYHSEKKRTPRTKWIEEEEME